MAPARIVVMGVSGSGKSTVARELAARLGVPFLEADDFHTAANRRKMASAVPLDDADRRPWLAALADALRSEPRVVLACSALKRSYRDALRGAGGVGFVHLVVDRQEVLDRVGRRTGHFMPAALVESQFAALEPAGPGETDVAAVDARGEVAAVVDRVEAALATLPVPA